MKLKYHIAFILLLIFALIIGISHSKITAEKTQSQLVSFKENNNQNSNLEWKQYCNPIYDYCIKYPSNILTFQFEPAEKEGKMFYSKSNNSALTIDAERNSKNLTIREKYQNQVKQIGGNGYAILNSKLIWKTFRISYQMPDGTIRMQKTFLKKGIFITSEVEYKEGDKEINKKIANRILSSMRSNAQLTFKQ